MSRNLENIYIRGNLASKSLAPLVPLNSDELCKDDCESWPKDDDALDDGDDMEDGELKLAIS